MHDDVWFCSQVPHRKLYKLFTSTVSQQRKFYLIFTVFYHYTFYYSFLIQPVGKELFIKNQIIW